MMKWEVRWIDAVCDEEDNWTYNETRHVCEIETAGNDIEQAKAALLDYLRKDECHAVNIAGGFYDWEETTNTDPIVIELVVRGNRQPLYSITPID